MEPFKTLLRTARKSFSDMNWNEKAQPIQAKNDPSIKKQVEINPSRGYSGVITRFLRKNERLISSEENEMPLVIEADNSTDIEFLKEFLTTNSAKIVADISKYGALLLRGFDIKTDEDFEKAVLSIQEFKGISDAFMSEEGRVHTGNLKYVLHTNAMYKTGGTVYLGGFHSENYYSADVPGYISFCCFKPSIRGGETGLINMAKVYHYMDEKLKKKLEKSTFLASKWLVSEVAERYQIPPKTVEQICAHFDLPIAGKKDEQWILMYKPSIFVDPNTHKKALQINQFELPTLNKELRKCFMDDYSGKEWFWHRLVWRLPAFVLNALEVTYMVFASFLYSPKNSFKMLRTKFNAYKSLKKKNALSFNEVKVADCFNEQDIKNLAKLLRNYYSSCLWQKGDILLVNNKQVVHAGMPGTGDRLIRAMICNPIAMNYSFLEPGCLECTPRQTDTIGSFMTSGNVNIS